MAGIVALPSASVSATSIYWLKDAAINAGLTDDGDQKTVANFADQTTFAGWDFTTIWNPPAGGPPTLR